MSKTDTDTADTDESNDDEQQSRLIPMSRSQGRRAIEDADELVLRSGGRLEDDPLISAEGDELKISNVKHTTQYDASEEPESEPRPTTLARFTVTVALPEESDGDTADD